ncbi:amino acid ABC transporter permease [Methylobacterium nodulans]|uniref:Polar amino acid ABC transporter, inner membrane subunit n=1 Tax=Methylobacterium nodulans (strain LMG 21967 / CNCM I-2342 / ORS 2060) TaxID=460265 RepID=B8IXQ4_METNO|nr:amino acid ABC transporter permease [Methylobacterium nodulans]ACL62886.1 polar amino acid ABC transporter, inner membrane subunit [Methylobacterium nodulans ORS 2060]
MSGAVLDPRLHPVRAAPRKKLNFSWSDPRFRNIVWQVVILSAVTAVAWFLISNTNRNLEQRRIATGFAFLSRTAGIPIGEHLIDYDPAVSTYGRALLIGVLNTLKVAVVGVVLATLWGTLLGIARLSRNWLVSKLAAVYVEIIRDVPLLLQLLFWYSILQALPAPRQSFHPVPGVFLSNRGVKIPFVEWDEPYWWALLALTVGAVGTWAWSRAATRRQERIGTRPKVWPMAILLMVGFPVAVWAGLGAPFVADVPELRGFDFNGGGTISPEYGALTMGLVIYTAAFIAEIVRSGILAVPTGQWEAAAALGVRRGIILRKIVLPQALRVIIPPMTSQYLNLIKNSSLAVAIGYQDIVSIANTTLNQTGQAIEGIAMVMLVYLVISLSISLFMNWYNGRIALVER